MYITIMEILPIFMMVIRAENKISSQSRFTWYNLASDCDKSVKLTDPHSYKYIEINV